MIFKKDVINAYVDDFESRYAQYLIQSNNDNNGD